MTATIEQKRKLRGGYYTPDRVAIWLSEWAIRSSTDRVLEPSCGDGAFLRAARRALSNEHPLFELNESQLIGVEQSPEEADKAAEVVGDAGEVFQSDFFEWLDDSEPQSFDVVLGNPPFIRFQNFPEPSRTAAMDFMKSVGLRPNRLTNIWVPFVVASIHLLKPGGRLAMVLPAELLQVTYAGQLRELLADSFKRATIFACNEMFFDGAQQEVVLLAAEDRLDYRTPSNNCDVKLIEAKSVEDLLSTPAKTNRKRNASIAVRHDSEKWLKYFLSSNEIGFMRSLRSHELVSTLAEHASVDVGVVTGKNQFFVVSQDEIQHFDLHDYVIPIVGRSSQIPGAIHRLSEHRALKDDGKRVFLLHLADHEEASFNSGLNNFIRSGEQAGHHLGYKCSIRKFWYRVPSVWEPNCFFFRQIYDFPRVVVNKAGATSTDTVHRMRCSASPQKLAANLYTHLTAASAEIEGRSYGGGVLELEPTEAERLLVPRQLNGAMPIVEADKLIRNGRLVEVLEFNDRIILQDFLGLSKTDCKMLKQVWSKMKLRRLSRRKRRP